MRTTLTVDDDVIEEARELAKRSHKPFRTVVNAALRAGLRIAEEPSAQQVYQTKPHPMGLRNGRNLDNIQELIALTEGDNVR